MKIPFGNTALDMDFSYDALLESRINELKGTEPGIEIVRRAMENPIASPRISELAAGKKNATIIISDHTRPVPSKDIIPLMLQELRRGNKDIEITLLVATGFHRGTTKEELIDKLGEEIVEKEKIVIHDSQDADSNVQIGILPSGAPLVINRLAVETELLVAEGFIEPHFFAGFSGGRKSVLPGICDMVTVLGNHCSKFIDSPYARTGILKGNPLHRDMLSAARLANLQFIVNVIIDEEKHTVAAFAGDMEQAHLAGCNFIRNFAEVSSVPGDIVITSNGGSPLDQNIYQCVKGMTAAEASAKPGAVIIMCANCADGVGGDSFYHSIKDSTGLENLYADFMATPQSQTIPDQWQSQVLARILIKHKVIFVSRPEMKEILTDMKFIYAPDLKTALDIAYAKKGSNATVTAIPNGISVIITRE